MIFSLRTVKTYATLAIQKRLSKLLKSLVDEKEIRTPASLRTR